MISIITPTYNRAYILPQCYRSLCEQSDTDFEWIVIDDGSTDETEQLINSFIAENKISIKYFKQPNGGKHRAHNLGVLKASGNLSVCLDSDDMLSPDAIKTAKEIWRDKRTDDSVGILALRGDIINHNPICTEIPVGLTYSTMSNLRDKFGFEGDTVLFFETKILKENLFKEFDGEKFLPENNLYCDIDCIGKMILINSVLYYCEYQPDGLTAKYHKLLFNNPKGTADTYYKMAVNAPTFLMGLKYAIISKAYNNLLPKTERLTYSSLKFKMLLAQVAAPIFDIKYLRKFKK